MKQLHKAVVLIVILVILIAVTYVLFFRSNNKQNDGSLWQDYQVIEYELEGTSKKLIVAENMMQWQKGLMYVRKPIKGIDGMIFMFPAKSPHVFWNKNTFMNLTVFWISEKKVVGKSDLPSIEKSGQTVSIFSPEPVDTVIEIY